MGRDIFPDITVRRMLLLLSVRYQQSLAFKKVMREIVGNSIVGSNSTTLFYTFLFNCGEREHTTFSFCLALLWRRKLFTEEIVPLV